MTGTDDRTVTMRNFILTARSLRKATPTALLRSMTDVVLDRQIQAIERPDPSLLKYYLLTALVIPPLFPVLGLVLYFRYHTMRYRFTDDGISMSWGVLFRRQIIVNYARIQDIHLRSNVVERWLGLARILVQTASGSSSAEMTIEGIKEFEGLRDFLYSRMRGVKDGQGHPPAVTNSSVPAGAASSDELTTTLREVARELRGVREALASRDRQHPEGPRHV
ncbi:MAG: PH domain-containing protein [Opitutus sp.]